MKSLLSLQNSRSYGIGSLGEGRGPGIWKGPRGRRSHLPPDSVVVEPHARVDVSVRLPGVQKVLREALPEAHVGAAAAPLPGVLQAGAGRGQGGVFRNPVAQALTALKRVQLQAMQLATKGLFVPAPGLVAAAGPQFAQGARVRYGVHHAGCRNGVGESALSETCG